MCAAGSGGQARLDIGRQQEGEPVRSYIGVDLAKYKHSATVIREGGERTIRNFTFANSREGFRDFLGRLAEVGAGCDDAAVCLESTGHYGRNLIAFLEAHGYEVFEINPILTANWRKSMSVRKVKNDAVDAEALALWLLAGNPTKRRRSASELDDLRTLARSRTSLSHIIGDAKRRAIAILDIVFPEYHGFFSDDFGKAGMALLSKYPGAAVIARTRVDAIENVLHKASGRFDRATAERLKALAKASVGQDSPVLGFELKQLLAQIEFTQGQMEELDAELERLVSDSPITSIPGVGKVCAAGILGEIGDISRFADASKLVAFAGCDPSVFESGEFEGTNARLSKRGSPYLRWYLFLAADRARMFDPVLKEYYRKKRSEGKCHKVAISAVVRKLCAIIFAVLKSGKPYVCPIR